MAESPQKSRQQMRAEVRRILSYVRALNRLREISPDGRFHVRVSLYPEFKILEGPDWTKVKTFLARFRPVLLDSEKMSFRNIIKCLPEHVTVDDGGAKFRDLEARWDALLEGGKRRA